MLQLRPLDKTVAGQELIQIGEKRGMEKGVKKGEIIGKIQMSEE